MTEERFPFWFRVTDPIKFEEQSIGNAEAVLKLAREWAKAKKLPKLTTDDLPAYERGRSWALGWCNYWAFK